HEKPISFATVANTKNLQSLAFGYYTMGNYALDDQVHQYATGTSFEPGKKYYCEVLILTPGPVIIGFASSVAECNNENKQLPKNLKHCYMYDPYARQLLVRQDKQSLTNEVWAILFTSTIAPVRCIHWIQYPSGSAHSCDSGTHQGYCLQASLL